MNKYTLWSNMEYEEVDYMNSYGINVECVKSDPIGKTYLATTNANPTRGIQWIEENPGPDHLFSAQDLYILKFCFVVFGFELLTT
ncbi:hypothetical protein L596_027195 [Steinernema carpocapsae]|uniref:Uncharacterized protein n=1 Tax=Steinernema carpocapsae TaxID=34508 RepID=A0A4V5ZYE4_STECR|nr:hypothetical protein L596_027195 [Steinernema carpocapsae]